MTDAQPPLVMWHASQVTPEDRQGLLSQKPITVWLTGLSASGKSTLAFALEQRLLDKGQLSFVLDGDNVRHGLNSNLGFSAEDRAENIRRVAEVAKLMNEAGLIVIAAFISPFTQDRALARTIIGAEHFREVHVSTSLRVCESRDPKGMYNKARLGNLPNFTGISSPYEVPEQPHLRIDTQNVDLDAGVDQLIALINGPH
ncbi:MULTISPECIES: adenylyl-sulfate kinase [unclassified Pseudomonas]|uniref:adenylyl-sulfate kinase n=2 Tax=Pseudomonas TaxID=286 RepID=UPI00128C4FBA|nr:MULTISPECIES: adenylyl-sulfate kinase [unclassified Pseudomonas]MPQ66247.1 adenylyl-sulfate kinase [Pseudomonas sp. MWU12-2323]